MTIRLQTFSDTNPVTLDFANDGYGGDGGSIFMAKAGLWLNLPNYRVGVQVALPGLTELRECAM